MIEITEETFDSWWYGLRNPVWTHYWHEYTDVLNNSPACVPKVILRLKDGIDRVEHRMKVDCQCPENSNATVLCCAATNGRKFYKTFHKPGHCPFIQYGGLKQKGD